MSYSQEPLDGMVADPVAPATHDSPGPRAQTSRRKKMSTATETRRQATLKDLLNKPARTKDVVLTVPDEDGMMIEYVFSMRAIGSKAYDVLVGMHPPTPDQKREGATYNPDSFGPALISMCSANPRMTPNEAKELWESDEWSRGEVMEIFMASVEVNSRGLDVPFTAADSGTTRRST